MPWDEECPHCHRTVAEWFVEWYSFPQQREIGKKSLAADCPWCHMPVLIRGLRVSLPPLLTPSAHREYPYAEAWANRNGYPSLESFLQNTDPKESERARPFRRGYWPNVNLSDPPVPRTGP
jgi:hypothetical protein